MRQIQLYVKMHGFRKGFLLVLTNEDDINEIIGKCNGDDEFIRLGDNIIRKSQIEKIEIKV